MCVSRVFSNARAMAPTLTDVCLKGTSYVIQYPSCKL